jgi:hypothetical protein
MASEILPRTEVVISLDHEDVVFGKNMVLT